MNDPSPPSGAIRDRTIRWMLITGSFSSFVALLFTKGLGLVESVFVARILGSYDFGVIALVLAVTNLTSAVGTLGIPSALRKFISGEANSQLAASSTLRTAWHFTAAASLGTGLISILVVLLASPLLPDSRLASFLALGIGITALSGPIVLFTSALQGLGRITQLNVRVTASAALGLALVVVLSFFLSTPGAIAGILLATAVPGVLCLRAVMRAIKELPHRSETRTIGIRDLMGYGLPWLISGLVVLLALYLLNSYLASTLGFSELGTFAVAVTLANAITFIPLAIAAPLVPIVSSLGVNEPVRGKALVPRVMRVTVFTCVPIVCIAIVFSKDIVRLTYGDGMAEAGPLLSIMAVGMLVTAVSSVIGTHLTGIGRMWFGLLLNGSWSLATLAISFVLVGQVGAIGASIGITMGNVTLAVVSFVIGRRVLGLQFHGVMLPSLWAAAVIGLAQLVSVTPTEFSFSLGAGLTVGATLSAIVLMDASERSMLRELVGRARYWIGFSGKKEA